MLFFILFLFYFMSGTRPAKVEQTGIAQLNVPHNFDTINSKKILITKKIT